MVFDNDVKLRTPRNTNKTRCKDVHSRWQERTCAKVVCPGLVVTSASVSEKSTAPRVSPAEPLAKHTPGAKRAEPGRRVGGPLTERHGELQQHVGLR